jgi:hypothetical protein
MAIRLKNMAVSLKTGPVVADKCGNETASQISALPASQDRACFGAYCQQLADLSNADTRKGLEPEAKLPAARGEILLVFSGIRTKCHEGDRCRNEALAF